MQLQPGEWIHLVELGVIVLLYFASKGRELGGGFDDHQRRLEALERWQKTCHQELYEGDGILPRLKGKIAAILTAIALLDKHTGANLPPLRDGD